MSFGVYTFKLKLKSTLITGHFYSVFECCKCKKNSMKTFMTRTIGKSILFPGSNTAIVLCVALGIGLPLLSTAFGITCYKKKCSQDSRPNSGYTPGSDADPNLSQDSRPNSGNTPEPGADPNHSRDSRSSSGDTEPGTNNSSTSSVSFIVIRVP